MSFVIARKRVIEVVEFYRSAPTPNGDADMDRVEHLQTVIVSDDSTVCSGIVLETRDNEEWRVETVSRLSVPSKAKTQLSSHERKKSS